MSQTTIPLQFEQYLLDKITAGAAPNLDEFVFAYIPNLDPDQPIDRATGLPDESFIVHRQNVDQTARLNRNTLIYSVIVPSHVAPFTFNAMYLHDKNVPESCGLIVHKTDETKESGMATTKSVAQEYDGAAEIAGIHIDPETWQIDYHARLFGIDEEIRLTQLDKYGHTAFISGFNVVKLTSNDYRVDPGIVYVGGLRCELKTAVTRTVTAKPNGLYVDVVREGSTLSKWENVPTIKVSNTPLSDYVDEQDYQHYVARLAGVDASGNVQDWREWDIVSQSEAEEGTSAIRRFWSALRITQLISAWWNRSAMKTKLDGIQEGAQVNRQLGTGAGQVCEGNDHRLSNAREWIADIVPQAEAEGGESSTPRKWTAKRVHQAFNKFGIGKDIDGGQITDLNVLLPNGVYAVSGNATGRPTGVLNSSSSLYVSRAGVQGILFYVVVHGSGIYVKTYSAGAWSDWTQYISSANEQQIGVGQTWINVTANRSPNVTYTNNTNKPIAVFIDSATANLFIEVGNVTFRWSADQATQESGIVIVPVGETYKVQESFTTFLELR